ncbi:MAG: hypothetical protein QOG10_6870, partial [Kribbellaceae bacterium]|nr:hypothetical protein [Kribbellaceae bacterium]
VDVPGEDPHRLSVLPFRPMVTTVGGSICRWGSVIRVLLVGGPAVYQLADQM